MAYTPPKPLWAMVADLERQQIAQWRAEYYRSEDLESVLAERLLKIEVTVSKLRGGNVSVTVAILAKKDSDSCAGYFRLQRQLNNAYSVESGTFSDA